ncbi:unnamed protein product [Diamesa serratosioi]
MSISTWSIIEKNETLELVMTIPTVQQQRFEEFDVWPVPDLIKKTIIDITNKTIAVNQKDRTYFYPKIEDVRNKINKSITIIENQIVQIAEAGRDCVVDALFQTVGKRSCNTRPITENYDEWHPLPAKNHFAFYTAYPADAAQVCKYTRTPINQSLGILVVESECQVTTRHHRIFGQHSERINKGYSFHIAVATENPLHPAVIERTERPKKFSVVTLTPVNEENLVAVEQEAEQLTWSDHGVTNLWSIIGIGCGTALIVLGIGTTIMYWKSSHQIPKSASLEMTHIAPLPTVKPTPVIRTWPTDPCMLEQGEGSYN